MFTLGIILVAIAALTLVYWFLLQMICAEDAPATEVHTVLTPDGWRIKLYRVYSGSDPGEPVFFVHGFVANPFNFLYPKGRSMAEAVAAQGYDCWVIDLRGNRRSKPPLGISRHNASFADYYNLDIPSALDHIQSTTGYDKVHWIGHSMGGMLLYATAAVHGTDRIASGTTLASPPGFRLSRTAHSAVLRFLVTRFPFFFERLVHAFAPLSHLEFREHSPIPVNARNMPSGMMYYNMVELPPVGVLENMDDWSYTRMWVLDGNFSMDSFLPTMDFPLHLVAAAEDSLAPPAAIEELFHQLPTRDKKLTVLSLAGGASINYNHIDIPFGLNAQTELFDPVTDWLARHSFPRTHDPEEPSVLSKEVQAQFRELVSDAPDAAETTLEVREVAAPRKSAPKTGGKDSALWGKALEDASSILDSLEEKKKPKRKSTKKKAAKKKAAKKKAAKKKAAKKKAAAAKKSSAKKPAAKKSGQKSNTKKTSKKKSKSKKKSGKK